MNEAQSGLLRPGLLITSSTSNAYVLVWETVSKQERLLVLSQKQGFKFRNLFFFYKDTFIYHINLEELKKQNLVACFCVFFKIWLWKEAKNILKICPNLLHF